MALDSKRGFNKFFISSPPFFHTITGKNKTMQPVEKTILAIQFEFLPGKMLVTKITEANKK
jgi:hypothetical protein